MNTAENQSNDGLRVGKGGVEYVHVYVHVQCAWAWPVLGDSSGQYGGLCPFPSPGEAPHCPLPPPQGSRLASMQSHAAWSPHKHTNTPHVCPGRAALPQGMNCTVAVVTVRAPHSGGLAPSPQPLPQIVREFALPPGGRCPPESLLTGLPYTSPIPYPPSSIRQLSALKGPSAVWPLQS